jgi:MFS family permease
LRNHRLQSFTTSPLSEKMMPWFSKTTSSFDVRGGADMAEGTAKGMREKVRKKYAELAAASQGGGTRGSAIYRWVLVVALAVMVNVGYGTIFYSFGVLLGEGAAASEFGRALLSASLGLGVVVSGALAPLIGAYCDARGPRWVYVAGAALGCLGLAAFSRSTEGWQVVAAWALLLGPAMACVFYEPAYVGIGQWFGGRQGKPLGLLTLIGGLSVTVFLPLSQWLVGLLGWRGAVLALGIILLATVVPLSLLVVRDKPRGGPVARERRLDPKNAYAGMLGGLRRAGRTFWLITAAYSLGLAATFGMLFHQVAYLQDLGFPPGGVAAAVGITGLVSLPARFALPALGDHVGPTLLAAAVFVTMAASALAVFGASEWWRVYLYVALFGVAFGAVLPMRAVVMSRHFAGALYGRHMGLQYAVLALAIAGGPALAGALRDLTGTYAIPWLGAAAMLVLAVPPILLVRKEDR